MDETRVNPSMETTQLPGGLIADQQAQLLRYAELAQESTADELRARCAQAMAVTERAAERLPSVNVELARGIYACIAKVLDEWDSLHRSGRYWVGGAVLYFAVSNDEAPDFESRAGFEDDARVLRSCLELAGREDLAADLG